MKEMWSVTVSPGKAAEVVGRPPFYVHLMPDGSVVIGTDFMHIQPGQTSEHASQIQSAPGSVVNSPNMIDVREDGSVVVSGER